jgi:hypothetical protein
MFGEIIVVSSENLTKYLNTLCGPNADFLIFILNYVILVLTSKFYEKRSINIDVY